MLPPTPQKRVRCRQRWRRRRRRQLARQRRQRHQWLRQQSPALVGLLGWAVLLLLPLLASNHLHQGTPFRRSSGINPTNVGGASSNHANTTAVLPPAADVSVEDVAAVQPPASAKAAASVQGVASVQAHSVVSISFFVRFVLSEVIYTNSYRMCSVFIPFRLYQVV